MSDKDNEQRINELENRMQAVEDKITALVELQKISDDKLGQLSAMLIHPGA